MVFRKRARARRPLRRRKTRRGTSKVPKATKAFVQKAISRKMESKMVQESDAFFWNSEDAIYNRKYMYAASAVGVTDRGRIGNTIWGTKIVVKYKISGEHFAGDPENPDLLVPDSLPAFYCKIFLVKIKSNYADILEQWFKSKDRGSEFPVLPLNEVNIQNGLNVLNTDFFNIIKMKTVKMKLTRDNRNEVITGAMTHRFKKPIKITLNENSTNVTDANTIDPLMQVLIYPYWGTPSQWGGSWGIQYSIQQYYKD